MDTFAILTKVFTDLTSNQFLIIDVWIFVLLLVFLFFLFILIRKLTSFKYKYSGKLLSNAERFFFLVLKQSLSEDDYEIFVKVRIADILTPVRTLMRRDWFSAFYKISSKHFDYVLCDKETLAVVAVIELDDSSHNLSKTRARDIFVEKACKTAGLKLIRFPCKSNYHLESIRDKIINSLNPLV
jgi:very-short-patch-repair endonuclease